MASVQLAILNGLKRPNIACATARTSATHCIGLAAGMIQCGDADAMLAGGAECAITETAIGGFCSPRALSTRNDAPARASRPWDKHRDGFVMSEGAGVVLLGEYAHAGARRAHVRRGHRFRHGQRCVSHHCA